jgi:hypothetical protein
VRRRIRRKKDENVLVHKLVGHHQGGDRNSKLAPGQAARQAIPFLEPVNVVEGEDYDRLRDLGGLEDFLHELSEVRGNGELEGSGVRARVREEMVATGRGRV